MNNNVKMLAHAVTTAIAISIISVAMLGNASAAGAKNSSPAAAPPPPSWGYLGSPAIVMDYALAQSWSLEWPHYTQQIFDYCDYRNCKLELRNGSWVPVWHGPPN